MDRELSCGCDEALRLGAELGKAALLLDEARVALKYERLSYAGLEAIIRGLAASAQSEHEKLLRRRLEVLELKLRARGIDLRYQHVSAIPELAVHQKARRDRNRERLVAVMALRSFAR